MMTSSSRNLALQTAEIIPFKRTLKQRQATKVLAAVKHCMLYGGSRSGKTFIIVRSLIIRCLKARESRHLILREHFNHVKQSIWYDTFPKVMELCFPDIEFKENKSDWFIQFANGSQLWFGGTDDKERVEKILGNEYATIYANECSQISYEAIALIRTRLAQKVHGLKNKFWYDCNPPSKKHWTYVYFVEHKDPISKEPIANTSNIGFLHMNPEDNLENLPDDYIEELQNLPKKQRERFLKGIFGSDTVGALWNQSMIDRARTMEKPWKLMRTVMGVDPATTNNEDSDDWGIGIAQKYTDGKSAVRADYTKKCSPEEAARIVINAYAAWDVDAVVVETNQGGDLVESVLRLCGFKGKIIKVHAAKGKFSRAEPISALYEQGLVWHDPDADLDELETEQTEYVPLTSKKSPNRLDWSVYALTELNPVQQSVVW
jgi:PBSX family phage terminase large subunit